MFLALLLCWVILVLVRLGVRMAGSESAKSLPIQDMVMVTSLMFALMLSFAAAGIWNDWVQARGAVQREALALENVLALADGLSPERAAKVRAGVIAYAKGAAEQEWPAMAEQVDMDDRSLTSRTARSSASSPSCRARPPRPEPRPSP